MRLPNALRLAKVDSIGPAAGAVVVGVEIWPFAKFESGPAGHSEDRADPRALNDYTGPQSTSPAVSARGLRPSPRWADGRAVPFPHSPPLPRAPTKHWSLALLPNRRARCPRFPCVRRAPNTAPRYTRPRHTRGGVWSPLVWEFPNTCLWRALHNGSQQRG